MDTGQQILAALDEEGTVEELRRLVRFPSVTGQEHEISAYLAERFEEIGLEVQYQEVTPGRYNVIGTAAGADGGQTLLLNGHMDVVPPGDGWSEDPFGGVVKDGFVWGRGSVDMKGGIAALIAAVHALKDARISFKGCLQLTAVVDEEETESGMKALVAGGIRADQALVAEPTSLRIVTTHKGLASFAITTRGVAAHASAPEQGVSAIDVMRRVMDALDQHRLTLSTRGHTLLGVPTLVVGTIRGGVASCIVPPQCTIEIDRRLLPGEVADRVQDELASLLCDIEPLPEIVRQVEARPLETSSGEAIVTSLQEAARRESLPASCCGWPAVSDAHILAHAGVPVVLFGPGDLQCFAHKVDERLSKAELVKAARVYCRLLGNLLG